MGETTRQGGQTLAKGAVIALGLALASSVGVMLWLNATGNDALIARYNALSEELHEKRYTRAPPPPEAVAALEDGAAAPLYKEAWRLLKDAGDAPDQLSEVVKWLGGEAPGGEPRAEIAPECLDAGAPPGSRDPVLLRLEPEVCDYLNRAAPAIVLASKASQRSNNRSPVHVWERWEDVGAAVPSYLPFLVLGNLSLLQGHIDGLGDDQAKQLDRTFVAARMGVDLSQGSGLLGAMLGTAMVESATKALIHTMHHERLGDAALRRVIAELTRVQQGWAPLHDAMVGEYLWVTALLLHQSSPDAFDQLTLPTALAQEDFTNYGSGNMFERLFLKSGIKEYEVVWAQLMVAHEEPLLSERFKTYDAVEARLQQSSNPITSVLMVDYGRFDRRVSAARVQLALTRLLAMAQLHALRHDGALPSSIADLKALGELPVDLITGEPFAIEAGALKSPLTQELSARMTEERDRLTVRLKLPR